MEARLDPGGFRLVLEALRFYRTRNPWVARILFAVSCAVFLVPEALAGLTPDDAPFIAGLTTRLRPFFVGIPELLDSLPYLLGLLATLPVASYIGLVYGTALVNERVGISALRSLLSAFRSIPVLLAFYALLAVPLAFGAFLFFIPSVAILLMTILVPLLLTTRRMRLFEAMVESYEKTRGHRIRILFRILSLELLTYLPTVWIMGAASLISGSESRAVLVSVSACLNAAVALMGARLRALIFLLLVHNDPVVVPSTAHRDR